MRKQRGGSTKAGRSADKAGQTRRQQHTAGTSGRVSRRPPDYQRADSRSWNAAQTGSCTGRGFRTKGGAGETPAAAPCHPVVQLRFVSGARAPALPRKQTRGDSSSSGRSHDRGNVGNASANESHAPNPTPCGLLTRAPSSPCGRPSAAY